MIDFISLSQLYINHFERRLKGRYICLKHIDPILFDYEKIDWVEVSGSSEKGKKIPLIKIGNGPKKVLAWSQMHGNESTTTKALFDLFAFLAQKEVFQDEIATFFSTFTIFAIPILNPMERRFIHEKMRIA
ncbi:MAG: M14 family zinc carboxypeptidase [Flavobacteriaceae bacterium]